jgi:N-acyl-D-aspartate/D-glutamate deacylase
VKPEDRDRAMRTMERNEAVRFETMKAGMPWDWVTFPEFLASLQRTPKGVNMLSFVGLNPLMSYVMGLEAAKSRPATPAEVAEHLPTARGHSSDGPIGLGHAVRSWPGRGLGSPASWSARSRSHTVANTQSRYRSRSPAVILARPVSHAETV